MNGNKSLLSLISSSFIYFFLAVLTACNTGETDRDRFFLLGNEALENNEFDQAIQFYTQSINADPDFASAYNNRGVAKVEDGRPHEAILDYNRAIEIDSAYQDARFNRVYALEQAGRVDEAFEDLQFIQQSNSDSAYIHFYMGLLLTKLNDYESAKSSFYTAIALDSTNLESFVNLATLYYFQNELDSSEYWLKYVMKRDPNEANAYNTISQVFIARGDYQLALGALNQALKIVPREPYFLNNRGFVYLQMDSLALGLEDINKSILANPFNAWAYRNKGIYHLKKRNYSEALRLFNEALSRNTFLDEIYSYIGEAQYAMGEKEQACGSWSLGVEKNEIRSASFLDQYCD